MPHMRSESICAVGWQMSAEDRSRPDPQGHGFFADAAIDGGRNGLAVLRDLPKGLSRLKRSEYHPELSFYAVALCLNWMGG